MFDVDDFLGRCVAAGAEEEPRRSIRDVLDRTMRSPGEVAQAMAPTAGGLAVLHSAPDLAVLHSAPDLTVLHVVWAPGMEVLPHDHRMWAAIGIYTGTEGNSFYRRSGPDRRRLTGSGGTRLDEGDTIVLGGDAIHGVANPRRAMTGAFHIYGGDFVNQPRSQWRPGSPDEQPYDVEESQRQFAEANAAWAASRDA